MPTSAKAVALRPTRRAAKAATAPSPLAVGGALSAAQWNQLITRIGTLPKPKLSNQAEQVGDSDKYGLGPPHVWATGPGRACGAPGPRPRSRRGLGLSSGARGGPGWLTGVHLPAGRPAPEGSGEVGRALALGGFELRRGRC